MDVHGDIEMKVLPEHLMGIYRQEEVAKFLATCSSDGIPNVALIISQIPVDEEKIVFGDFMMVKTKRNILENQRVASLAITSKLGVAGFKGELECWVQSGPYIDVINNLEFHRYNAYMGVHNAGVVIVRDVLELPERISYFRVIGEFALQKGARKLWGKPIRGLELPHAVRGMFRSISTIKVLSYQGIDGFPGIAPCFGITLCKDSNIRFLLNSWNVELLKMDIPIRVAINLFNKGLVSYQIKGEIIRFDKFLGMITAEMKPMELYSSSPPFCGSRVLNRAFVG